MVILVPQSLQNFAGSSPWPRGRCSAPLRRPGAWGGPGPGAPAPGSPPRPRGPVGVLAGRLRGIVFILAYKGNPPPCGV